MKFPFLDTKVFDCISLNYFYPFFVIRHATVRNFTKSRLNFCFRNPYNVHNKLSNRLRGSLWLISSNEWCAIWNVPWKAPCIQFNVCDKNFCGCFTNHGIASPDHIIPLSSPRNKPFGGKDGCNIFVHPANLWSKSLQVKKFWAVVKVKHPLRFGISFLRAILSSRTC